MYDTILIGVAALLNLILAYVGLYVAVRPVEQEKRKRPILIGCFAVSALALIVAVYLAARGIEAQTKLQGTVEHVDTGVGKVLGIVSSVQETVVALPPGNSAPPATKPKPQTAKPPLQNGFLQFKQFQYVTGDEFFTVGKPLRLNIYYINKGTAPVQNAYITGALALATRDGNSQQAMDTAVLKSLEPLARAQTDRGSALGVDNLLWTTPSLPEDLTQQMVDEIMQGKLVLYAVSYARWTDSYGKPNDVLECVWLNPPLNEHPELGKLVWQECTR
jgi:hypothetical protein